MNKTNLWLWQVISETLEHIEKISISSLLLKDVDNSKVEWLSEDIWPSIIKLKIWTFMQLGYTKDYELIKEYHSWLKIKIWSIWQWNIIFSIKNNPLWQKKKS